MDRRTKKKVLLIQDHLRKNYEELFALHTGNIVGVRLDKKVRGGKMLNYYAVICHVVKKLKPADLRPEQLVPNRLTFEIQGKKYHLFTDIEEVGEFKFQYAIGDTIQDFNANKEGTLGLFLTDGTNDYALTNYHVAAWNLMQTNQFYYDPTTGLQVDPLTIGGTAGLAMVKGEIAKTLDAAFIDLGPGAGVSNDLGNGNQVNADSYTDPDSLNRGDTLYAYRSGVAGGETVRVVNNSASYDPKYKGITFERLIAVERYSDPGDSGSIVVAPDFRVVGIVVGADNYSYLIPYAAIYAFNPLTIL